MPEWIARIPWWAWSLIGAWAFVAVVFAINRQPVPEDYSEEEGSDT